MTDGKSRASRDRAELQLFRAGDCIITKSCHQIPRHRNRPPTQPSDARSFHFFARPLHPVARPILALPHRAQSQLSRLRSPALDRHQSTDLNHNGPLQRSLPLGCAVRLWWRILYGSTLRPDLHLLADQLRAKK